MEENLEIGHVSNTEDNEDTCEECGASPVTLFLARNKQGQKLQACQKCRDKIVSERGGASRSFLAMFSPEEREVLRSLQISDIHNIQIAAKRLVREVITLRAANDNLAAASKKLTDEVEAMLKDQGVLNAGAI